MLRCCPYWSASRSLALVAGVVDGPAGTYEALVTVSSGEPIWRRQALAVSARAVLVSLSCGCREVLTTTTPAGPLSACRVPAMQLLARSAARGLLQASDSAELLRASVAPSRESHPPQMGSVPASAFPRYPLQVKRIPVLRGCQYTGPCGHTPRRGSTDH